MTGLKIPTNSISPFLRNGVSWYFEPSHLTNQLTVCIPAIALHSKHWCPHVSSSKFKLFASRIMNNLCKTSIKKSCALFRVVCNSLHADDLNIFHLIPLSLIICDPRGPKQNGYCWLYKIQTGNDCNFIHYKITLAVLHVTKWPESR